MQGRSAQKCTSRFNVNFIKRPFWFYFCHTGPEVARRFPPVGKTTKPPVSPIYCVVFSKSYVVFPKSYVIPRLSRRKKSGAGRDCTRSAPFLTVKLQNFSAKSKSALFRFNICDFLPRPVHPVGLPRCHRRGSGEVRGQNVTVPRLRSTSRPSCAFRLNLPARFALNLMTKSSWLPSSSRALLPRLTKVG